MEVADKQEISVGSITIKCLETPFHTLGHMCVRKLFPAPFPSIQSRTTTHV